MWDTLHILITTQAVCDGTQALLAKVMQAMTGLQAREIDFLATNILVEQNAEPRRREIQFLSLLSTTSIPVPEESTRLEVKSDRQNFVERASTSVIQFQNK
ncbi:MAG: hypothetical protein EZS28_032944 [Streblomastix strix]|uniref:Uncharacterized protein n=1 Tax=Streblomastix strix TaxID=222440 RepID=A0A5J4UNC4_9EUKA|nr:MAG: hypothetical protein EZS28_032944 [Streblomastix strix]